MKSQLVFGEGIQGMTITLNLSDMFAAGMMLDTLDKVINRHSEREAYLKCPYDERKEKFPEGCPQELDLSQENMGKIRTLVAKLAMSPSSKATIFDEKDENS